MFGTKLQECIGVELRVLGSDEFSCRWLQVNLAKEQLTIRKEKEITGGIKEILNALPKTYPVSLALTGKGILLKSIMAENEDPQQLLQQAFPSVEPDDFYMQCLSSGQTAHLALSRKEWIDELLHRFATAGLQVFDLSLGPFAVVQIIDQLNNYGNELVFDQHRFEFNAQHELLSYKSAIEFKNDFQFKIGNHPVAEQAILAYAMGFQLLLHQNLEPVSANVPAVADGFKNFIAQQEFKRNGLAFLFGIFFLLLISFGLFSYYNQENVLLAQQAGARESTLSNAESLADEVKKDEIQLQQLQWNGGYSYAFLIDQVAKQLPRQLSLSAIELKSIEGINQIKISGTTNNLQALNNWLFVLKQDSWVKDVKLLKYDLPEDGNSYQFNVNVNY